MFILSACKNKLVAVQTETITSGSVNAYRVQFRFNEDWDNLDRVAVFRIQRTLISVPLDRKEECQIPWEVMQENSAGERLYAGIYGVDGDEIVLPTMWTCLGTVMEGTILGPNAIPPTPSIAEQFLSDMSEERSKAEDAAKRAEDAAERAERAAAGGGTGGTGNVSSPEIQSIRVMDRADYESLAEKSDTTLYFIRG